VGQINGLDQNGGLHVVLEQEDDGGRTYYTLRSERFPTEVHYTFVEGYLIAAPTRSLIDSAIALNGSGTSLSASSRFTSLLPRDANSNFSAVAYQNLGSVLGPLASRLAAAPPGAAQTSMDRQAVQSLVADMPPSLAYAYGEEDRIVFASTRPGGLLGSDLDVLFGLSGLMKLQGSVEQVMKDGSAQGTSGAR